MNLFEHIVFQILFLLTLGLFSNAQVWNEPYFEPTALAQKFDQNYKKISFLFDENVEANSTLGHLIYEGTNPPHLRDSDLFKIQEEDGKFVLKNVVAIDYEKITAVDFRIISGEIAVIFNVFIGNLNDNPMFIVFLSESCIKMENREPEDFTCRYEIRDEDGISPEINISNVEEPMKWYNKSIGEKSGRVVLYSTKSLDFEETQVYAFKWSVSDEVFNDSTTVIVNVDDAPDTPPVWRNIFETQQFDEHSDQNFYVTALDGDIKVNDVIKYECSGISTELEENIRCETCRDDENKEMLCIKVRNLDINAWNNNYPNNYFWVKASEKNSPDDYIRQSISFKLNDINNNRPLISNVNPYLEIRENEYTTMGNLSSYINDRDLGKNALYKSELESTVDNFTASVQIVPSNGYQKTYYYMVVTNASLLDYDRNETMRDIDFKIINTETAPGQWEEVTQKMNLKLINWNDEKPIFHKDQYQIEINETFGRNSVEQLLITDLYALDADYGDEVSYQLLGNVVDSILEIEDVRPKPGEDVLIQTRIPKSENVQIFDYELADEVMIELKARDNFPDSEIINTAITQIKIKLLDVNDETPRISITHKTTRLDENVQNDTIITSARKPSGNLEISVVDDDTDAELDVYIDWDQSYATKNGQKLAWDKYNGCLRLEEITGGPHRRNGTYIVKTKEVVKSNTPDFELFDTMYLRIVVEDQKQVVGEGKASLMFVINVNNINDCPPKFIQSTIEARKTVIEHSRPGETIGTIRAIDEDIDAVIRYTMASADFMDLIDLNEETGEISVNKDIDADIPIYALNFIVGANDGKFYETANITIAIIDINDLTPNFDEIIKDVSIEEHSRVGTFIKVVIASDQDRDVPNNVIKYYLNNDPITNYFFEINEESGEITIKDDGLDRDHGPMEYEIVIIIKDNPTNIGVQNTNVASFKVTLIDINDNPPIIDTEKLPFIDEQIKKDDVIGIIEAHDDDEKGNDNSKIKFDILSITSLGENKLSNDDLIISTDEDHTSWRGTIKSKIDLEGYYGEYLLEIKTEDLGEPSLSYTKNVSLTIEKYNFYPPKLTSPNESTILLAMGFGVAEKLVTSYLTELPIFKASSTPPGKYNTRMELIDLTNIFELKRFGNLQYMNLPDETKDYRVKIVITDDGIPSRSTTTDITIKFMDFGVEPSYKENDISVYFDELACDETVPTAIADINAKKVNYYLIDDPSEAFLVDQLKGDLTITKSLVRKNFTNPFIKIVASHFDKPPTYFSIASTLNVKVELQSVNYRPPFFLSNEYFGGIMISNEIGAKILTVEARDKDENDTLTYRILEDTLEAIGEGISTDLTFIIKKINNEKADILLGFKVESNMKGRFTFKVEVSDGVHVADTTVTVMIMSQRRNVKYFVGSKGNKILAKEDKEQFQILVETNQQEVLEEKKK